MSTDAHQLTTQTHPESRLAVDHAAVSRFNAWHFTTFAGYLNPIESCVPACHATEAFERPSFSRCNIKRARLRRSLFWPVNMTICSVATN